MAVSRPMKFSELMKNSTDDTQNQIDEECLSTVDYSVLKKLIDKEEVMNLVKKIENFSSSLWEVVTVVFKFQDFLLNFVFLFLLIIERKSYSVLKKERIILCAQL